MNTFDAATGTFGFPFCSPPYTASNLHPRWTPKYDIFETPPRFHTTHTPFNTGPSLPPFHHRRRDSYYNYHPHHLRHQNQGLYPHPQWHSYRHVRSEESLQPEYPRPRPEHGSAEFQWRYPDFEGVFDLGRDAHGPPSPRPVSPLGHEHIGEGEVEYESGYAETIPDEDGDGRGKERLGARELAEEQVEDDDEHHDAVKATIGEEVTENPAGHVRETFNFSNQSQGSCPPHGPAHQATSSIFDARWQDLLARESHLATRETTFEEEQQNRAAEQAKLERDRAELDTKEYDIRQLQFELQVEQHRFRQERVQWQAWVRRAQDGLRMAREVDLDGEMEMEMSDDDDLRGLWEWGEDIDIPGFGSSE